MEFLKQNKPFSSRIAYSIFKRIYRLEDNSLLFIKSKRELTAEEFENIRTNSTAFMSLPIKEYQKENNKIVYRILELEDENDN